MAEPTAATEVVCVSCGVDGEHCCSAMWCECCHGDPPEGCQMCGAHPNQPCDCFDSQQERRA